MGQRAQSAARTVLVQVCSGCGACEADLMAELERLRRDPRFDIEVMMEDCLDTCESEPSFAVDHVSIAPATPEKLRRAIEGGTTEQS